MIFIWTSDGGPLQYISLFLFLLYQLHPFFFSPPLLEVEDESSSSSISAARRTRSSNGSADAVTSNDDDDDASLIFMMIFTCTVVALGILGVALYSNRNNVIEWFRRTRRQQQQQQQQQENSTTQQSMVPLYATLGSIAGIICGGSLWWWWNSDDPNISAIASDIYLTVLSLVQVIGFVYMVGSSFMRRQQENGNNNSNSSSNNSNKMIKIMSKIREMPIEEFYKNDKESYSCLSISQLKEMLRVRGMIQQQQKQQQQNGTKFLERSDLVSALLSCRKYSESCCICCEDYNDDNNNNNHNNNNNYNNTNQLAEEVEGGSDLGTRDILRIFPQCHHEFHLECLDQWAYTFQNKPDHLLPTCPLCKTPIK